jgi:hypothetical protein
MSNEIIRLWLLIHTNVGIIGKAVSRWLPVLPVWQSLGSSLEIFCSVNVLWLWVMDSKVVTIISYKCCGYWLGCEEMVSYFSLLGKAQEAFLEMFYIVNML